MADNCNFLLLLSALLAIAPQPLWKLGWPPKHSNDGGLRLMLVAPDRFSTYIGHAFAGVFLFDPTSLAAEDASARWVIATGDAGIGMGDLRGQGHNQRLRICARLTQALVQGAPRRCCRVPPDLGRGP
jgi:hypothetical protein